MTADEGPRATTLESLGKLPTVFKPDGVVTAGSSSGISDGVSQCLPDISSTDKKPLFSFIRRCCVADCCERGGSQEVLSQASCPCRWMGCGWCRPQGTSIHALPACQPTSVWLTCCCTLSDYGYWSCALHSPSAQEGCPRHQGVNMLWMTACMYWWSNA